MHPRHDPLAIGVPHRELRLHFPCANCDHGLLVPLGGVGGQHTCSNCAFSQSVPRLDEKIEGHSSVLNGKDADGTGEYRARCPSCRKRLRVPYHALKRAFHCPRCTTPLAVVITVRGTETLESQKPSSNSGDVAPRPPQPRSKAQDVAPKQRDKPPAPPLPQPEPLDALPVDDDPEEEDQPSAAENAVEPVRYPDPYEDEPPRSQQRSYYWRPAVIRRLLHILLICTITVPEIFLVMVGCLGLPCILGLFPVWLWWLRVEYQLLGRLAHWLTAFLVHRICCPGCGFETSAYGVWSIGSYTDHCERHILRVRSKIDGKRIGYLDCPECGATIML